MSSVQVKKKTERLRANSAAVFPEGFFLHKQTKKRGLQLSGTFIVKLTCALQSVDCVSAAGNWITL